MNLKNKKVAEIKVVSIYLRGVKFIEEFMIVSLFVKLKVLYPTCFDFYH